MRHETRIFYMANPALNRELDTAAMVEQAMAAIMQHKTFSRMLNAGPVRERAAGRGDGGRGVPRPGAAGAGRRAPRAPQRGRPEAAAQRCWGRSGRR